MSPEPGGHCGCGDHVEGCSCGGTVKLTAGGIGIGQWGKGSPLVAVHLVVDQSGHVDVAVIEQLWGGPGGNLHLEHEFHFPAGFVQEVRIAIGPFGYAEGAVAELGGVVVDSVQTTFVCHKELGGCNTTVDDVFALVAGIVPQFC